MGRPIGPSPAVLDPNIKANKSHPDCPQLSSDLERPTAEYVSIFAISKESMKGVTTLRGSACIQTTDMLLEADEVVYDENSGQARANGNVHFHHFEGGEEIWASRVEYDVEEQSGKFYDVRGRAPTKIDPRPGILSTTNPFTFQGEWAERMDGHYSLHNGFVTNCRVPGPIWMLRSPKIDIYPKDHAMARNAWFKVLNVPIFYSPAFYKSLKRQPRKSGFLTPNAGNSSRRGKMVGAGYYWAINRSYDAMYRGQLFTQRGFAHTMDFRGKPTQNSDFNLYVYGVNDRGLLLDDGERRKEGGFLVAFDGRIDLGRGFYARGLVNYLSSFRFRQAFTESFNEAVFAEVQSVGFVTKDWSDFGFTVSASRKENYQSTADDDVISVRRLPQAEFTVRDRIVSEKVLPVWVSLESTAGFLSRTQPEYQTRAYVQRADFQPRIMTALRWKDFHIIPAFSIRETFVASRFDPQINTVSGENIVRSAREFTIDVIPPSLAKVFDAPEWMGTRMKHVIEPHLSFRYTGGIEDFRQLIRFDETELMSNTREAEVSLANRFFVKRRSGEVLEAFSWVVRQKRYFDPTFGGALSADSRNVLSTSLDITGYSFLAGPRNYSPVISQMRVNPVSSAGIEWRTDYDPLLKRFSNSSITADARLSRYFVSLGHAYVRNDPRISPPFNQFRGLFAIGQENRRGWNAAFSAFYDFREGIMQFATTQVTYNYDCCGLSFQYRRFSFGTRNENQFRVAFAIANIGSFGTLKRQERIF